MGFFFVYLTLLFQKRKSDEVKEESSSTESLSIFKMLANLIFGFIVLFIGSSLSVDSSLILVESLSLSERFAGVFILSLSTSLPELATSLQAVLKKEGGIALGNIVGSNLFNTLFILGSASVLRPLSFSGGLYYDYFFMLVVTLMLCFILLIFKRIPKAVFVLFIVFYCFYISFVFGAFS